MTAPDTINGCFELAGSIVQWFNVWRLFQDRLVRGVSVSAAVFFICWGLWNLYFYPHLDQWASMIGAVMLTLANAVWVVGALWMKA